MAFLRDAVSNRTNHSNVVIPQPQSPVSDTSTVYDVVNTVCHHVGSSSSVNNSSTLPILPTVNDGTNPVSYQGGSNSPSSSLTQKASNKKRNETKRKKVDIDPVEDFLIGQIKKSRDNVSVKQDDEEDLFCLSIAHTLRRLETKKRMLAKIEIQKILFSIEFGENLSS